MDIVGWDKNGMMMDTTDEKDRLIMDTTDRRKDGPMLVTINRWIKWASPGHDRPGKRWADAGHYKSARKKSCWTRKTGEGSGVFCKSRRADSVGENGNHQVCYGAMTGTHAKPVKK